MVECRCEQASREDAGLFVSEVLLGGLVTFSSKRLLMLVGYVDDCGLK